MKISRIGEKLMEFHGNVILEKFWNNFEKNSEIIFGNLYGNFGILTETLKKFSGKFKKFCRKFQITRIRKLQKF